MRGKHNKLQDNWNKDSHCFTLQLTNSSRSGRLRAERPKTSEEVRNADTGVEEPECSDGFTFVNSSSKQCQK